MKKERKKEKETYLIGEMILVAGNVAVDGTPLKLLVHLTRDRNLGQHLILLLVTTIAAGHFGQLWSQHSIVSTLFLFFHLLFQVHILQQATVGCNTHRWYFHLVSGAHADFTFLFVEEEKKTEIKFRFRFWRNYF